MEIFNSDKAIDKPTEAITLNQGVFKLTATSASIKGLTTHSYGELEEQDDATCMGEGTIAYYECADCGGFTAVGALLALVALTGAALVIKKK